MEQVRAFPNLVMFRILSYLPLKCLFKFKCVCKLWSTLLLHPSFLLLRGINAPFSFIDMNGPFSLTDMNMLLQRCIDNPDKWCVLSFTTIYRSSHCLCIQKKITSDQYRIECGLLRDVLPIPSPQNPSVCIALEFVPIHSNNPFNGFVKLISAYQDGNNNLGFEILCLDIGATYQWRAIDNVMPLPRDGRMMNSIQFFVRRGVAYCICFVETTEEIDEMQVDVVDMVNEAYIGRTIFPRERFMSTTLHLLDWNGRLSFSQILKDELHVLVLDDHAKLKWAETKLIIKLDFLKQELVTFHACVDMSTLVFIRQDNKGKRFQCYYKMDTRELSSYEMCDTSSNITDAKELRDTSYKITDAELVAYDLALLALHNAGL